MCVCGGGIGGQVTPLVRIDDRQTGEKYVTTIAQTVLRFIHNKEVTFQHNNASFPCVTQQCLRDGKIFVLSWPAVASDLRLSKMGVV